MISQEKVVLYQDLYKAAWDKQNGIDRGKSSKIKGPQRNYHNREIHIANGKLGGAPRLKLSQEGGTIDRMLKKDILIPDIALMLGKKVKDIVQIVNRFKLPRKD